MDFDDWTLVDFERDESIFIGFKRSEWILVPFERFELSWLILKDLIGF